MLEFDAGKRLPASRRSSHLTTRRLWPHASLHTASIDGGRNPLPARACAESDARQNERTSLSIQAAVFRVMAPGRARVTRFVRVARANRAGGQVRRWFLSTDENDTLGVDERSRVHFLAPSARKCTLLPTARPKVSFLAHGRSPGRHPAAATTPAPRQSLAVAVVPDQHDSDVRTLRLAAPLVAARNMDRVVAPPGGADRMKSAPGNSGQKKTPRFAGLTNRVAEGTRTLDLDPIPNQENPPFRVGLPLRGQKRDFGPTRRASGPRPSNSASAGRDGGRRLPRPGRIRRDEEGAMRIEDVHLLSRRCGCTAACRYPGMSCPCASGRRTSASRLCATCGCASASRRRARCFRAQPTPHGMATPGVWPWGRSASEPERRRTCAGIAQGRSKQPSSKAR